MMHWRKCCKKSNHWPPTWPLDRQCSAPAKHQIATLEFSRNEWQGVSTLDRKAIFDLHCKTPDGTYFLVELQKAKQNFFKDRSLYYASFPIQEQGQKGDWDYRLQEMLLVQRFGTIPDSAMVAMSKADLAQLETWLQRVLTAQQPGDVFD